MIWRHCHRRGCNTLGHPEQGIIVSTCNPDPGAPTGDGGKDPDTQIAASYGGRAYW